MRIVVTGGNSGIGLEAVRAFVREGHEVVLACRSLPKGEAAAATVHGRGSVEVRQLDLASLASVKAFAERFSGESLDVLVNNAGVMALPQSETADGFEQQFGVNHLGHFALTARLWPVLARSSQARVVTVTSLMHRRGRLRMDDLQSAKRYRRWQAYADSKLANLWFCFELARRIDANGGAQRSVACHPGYAATNLQLVGPEQSGSRLGGLVMRAGLWFAQSAEAGAWPTVFAATREEADNGSFVGPGKLGELFGPAKIVRAARRAHDAEGQRRLWQESERLTGVEFPV